jgi:hypothetical protein
MPTYSRASAPDLQPEFALAPLLRQHFLAFLLPLLERLDAQIDRRLVRTVAATIAAILMWRNRAHGLLLSELGAYILSPQQAPAGTKRLSNLLHSPKWTSDLIDHWLWDQADAHVAAIAAAGETPLLIWDESVLEKPETVHADDLCSVRSSKAARLKRIKPGFYNPPGGRPIHVPGLRWLGLLLVGQASPPLVAAMHWWTTRGPHASDRRREESRLLLQCRAAWARGVVHVWDRGFAGSPWLGLALDLEVRFVLRWPKRYQLVDQQGRQLAAWKLLRGQRSWEQRMLWDSHARQQRKVGVVAVPVTHADFPDQLWLVAARLGKGHEPWYLLTSEPVETAAAAWGVVLAYGRRWQIEMTWRYGKSELGMESPRVWAWETRRKLLLLVTLAYAVLVSLLGAGCTELRAWLLRQWCHRTGKRSQETLTPLYRLRSAISRLWLAAPPHPFLLESSG